MHHSEYLDCSPAYRPGGSKSRQFPPLASSFSQGVHSAVCPVPYYWSLQPPQHLRSSIRMQGESPAQPPEGL